MSLCKLVTFDATNTLIRVLGSVGQQYARIAEIYGVKPDASELNAAFKKTWHQMNEEYPNYGASQGMTSQNWWSDVVKRSLSLACNQQKPDPTVVTQISGHLYKHFCTKQGWDVIPGSHEGLSLLKDKGLKLGIISNYDERLNKILMNLALLHYFDFVVVSSIEKVAKPNPQIFENALTLSNVNASEAIHVGDDVTNDYFGARNAGMKSVLFKNDPTLPVPDGIDKDSVISNLKEMIRFI